MTSEKHQTRSSPADDSTSGPVGDGVTEALPEPATSQSAETPKPGSTPDTTARRAARRIDLDWEREPGGETDPEDPRRGRADNLARLLDDVPPHHVDRCREIFKNLTSLIDTPIASGKL